MIRPTLESTYGARYFSRHRSVIVFWRELSSWLSSSFFFSLSWLSWSGKVPYAIIFGERKKPPQHRIESYLQQQSPQHSPFFLPTRSVSQTTTLRKMVMTTRYSIRIQTEAKRQKLRKAVRELRPPKAKARAFVREVIVMEGPACIMASRIRSLGVSFSRV